MYINMSGVLIIQLQNKISCLHIWLAPILETLHDTVPESVYMFAGNEVQPTIIYMTAPPRQG